MGNDLQALLAKAEPQFKAVAPEWMNLQRLVHLALQARSRDFRLAKCTPDSYLAFCLRCAETGLEPIGAGGAWAVAFENKKHSPPILEVQFIPDWRGLIWLAKKEGYIMHGYAEVVREGDSFSLRLGDNPGVDHEPALTGRGDVVGAYFVARLPDGTKHVEWMDVDELAAVEKASKAREKGPYSGPFRTEMQRKAVVKRGMKPFTGGSVFMRRAIEYDNEAVGLALPDYSPIREPQAKAGASASADAAAAPTKATPSAAPKPAEKAPKPKKPANSTELVTVVVGRLSSKSSTTRGRAWTKWSFKYEDEWYATFDGGLAKELESLEGESVNLRVIRSSKGILIDSVEIDEPESEPGEEAEQERVPF